MPTSTSRSAARREKVLKGLETQAQTAQFREKQLLADLNTLKAASARAGDEEVELRALEREAAAQRELLESYLTRYREASSRKDRNYLPADARIFSRAVAPSEPYFPKIVPIVGAAFVGSLLVMAIVTLLQELFQRPRHAAGRRRALRSGRRCRDAGRACRSRGAERKPASRCSRCPIDGRHAEPSMAAEAVEPIAARSERAGSLRRSRRAEHRRDQRRDAPPRG